MTKDELDAIEARANAATPPPWRATDYGGTNGVHGGPDDLLLLWSYPKDFMHDGDGSHASWADVEFAAEARSDVPRLVAEVRRLQKALFARLPSGLVGCACEDGHDLLCPNSRA